ncbi:MAG: Methionine-tRNA ligase [Candidatus Collierbacteria bacterium GW2011_GWC2_44_18]|uniref:Methionine-tRNA ligase n=1 Tax=Candidatus Collierbacteria bacterium GW2011_GWC2_44_18 TaxID=1618392 RepID=A0A0G1HP12_9BACT|nr:MAG: Methionine-tRNA ligase [Candidatus Collierbacteria bacterium GW2011_GWC2_44_18]
MKPVINYSDFEKLDIRVGRVISASAPEGSNKLLRMEVDMGEEIGKRTLFSGIRKWYKPEEVVGKNMEFVINMDPKKMGDPSSGSEQGGYSEGMLIMVDTEEQPILLFLPEAIKPGSVIR